MADDKKKPDEPQTITLTLDALRALVKDQVQEGTRSELAKLMTATTVDERMQQAMDAMRGKNRPLPPETLVVCRSPVTGATFALRLVHSKAFPEGRVVEMVDYARPEGWDRHREDGGLYEGPREMMSINSETGLQHLRYRTWVYQTFWQTDWNSVSGKPASFLAQWRIPAAQAAE